MAGSRPVREAERRVQTVVFTDVVSSTAGAVAAGDEAWHRLLDAHDRIAWEAVDRYSGSIVKSTGDGVLARFDSPSGALAFATEVRRALDTVGLQIRCGLHTGEIELRDDGAIFVSSTVCDLLLGGDACFDDRGEYQLKGFDRSWRLFSVATPI